MRDDDGAGDQAVVREAQCMKAQILEPQTKPRHLHDDSSACNPEPGQNPETLKPFCRPDASRRLVGTGSSDSSA